MRTISLFARVPLLLAAVAASQLPTASLRAAATSNAGPTEATRIRTTPTSASPSDRAVAFYYPWYGNPTTDGHYANWNHPVARFGASPACHRLRSHENKPVFFIYDSYLTPASEWATVLRQESTNSIRPWNDYLDRTAQWTRRMTSK